MNSPVPLNSPIEGDAASSTAPPPAAESTSSLPVTRLSVIEGCRHGSNAAWQTFFDVYGPVIYRFARRARLADHDAEDVVANAMRNLMKVLRGGFEVDYAVGRFRQYLRTVANREISAQRRRARSLNLDPQESPDIEAIDSDPDWVAAERRERLRLCLDRLRMLPDVNARDVLAFERYALQQEPAERVAAELGVSRSRLYVIKHEMLQHLRRLKAQLDEELGEV